MKKYIFLLFLALSVFGSCNFKETTTTYYLIRHAEKDRSDATNRNPNLNKIGLKRAENWKNYFKDIDLDAVYSTNYNRTQQTATPTAKSKNLKILSYDPSNMFNDDFQKNTLGKTVLIVGHSNTTPAFANKILKSEIYKQMDDNDNASLFMISFKTSLGKNNTQVKRLKID
ncbi:phosphoglycerate mutase family protein [Tenacibaculum soleae]|uniref:SixA phosphatase family protein n=1 Tax=Tenacibaculum soleae TaxID=447689 RepID=UPI0026E3B819|nr:phosphoglycerate mutase family protein [Tenacibaculum soleae]MDO6743870.1 phosphoglycerate mutase family protein [Tenacibaculum soleae]